MYDAQQHTKSIPDIRIRAEKLTNSTVDLIKRAEELRARLSDYLNDGVPVDPQSNKDRPLCSMFASRLMDIDDNIQTVYAILDDILHRIEL